MRIFTILLASLPSLYLCAARLAITIDDYPMPDGALFSTQERTHLLLKALDTNHCQAAFFVSVKTVRTLPLLSCKI